MKFARTTFLGPTIILLMAAAAPPGAGTFVAPTGRDGTSIAATFYGHADPRQIPTFCYFTSNAVEKKGIE